MPRDDRDPERPRGDARDWAPDHRCFAHAVPVPADLVAVDVAVDRDVVLGLEIEGVRKIGLVVRVGVLAIGIFVAEAERVRELVRGASAGVEVGVGGYGGEIQDEADDAGG